MQDISKALVQKIHLVFESGTGSGKTICALCSTLEFALANHKKIIYTTRTNAQQRQVIVELRAIRKKTGDAHIFGVGMQGRANMCLLARDNPDMNVGTSEELSRFCSSQKKKAQTNKKGEGCTYYRKYLHDQQAIEEVVDWTKKHLPTAEEFIATCEKKAICPYEINKHLIQDAQLIVVPYIYVFDTSIRNMLFDWLSISGEDVILVVDEAHNLPNYLRDLFSAELSSYMLKSCISEAKHYGDPTIGNGARSVSAFCTLLSEIVDGLRDTYIYGILESGIRRKSYEKQDAFIPSHELETELLSRISITSKTLRDIVADLIAYGEKIQEYRLKEGKLPRSYLHKLGTFLEFWITIEMNQYIKLVVDASDGKNPRIEAYCLDPSMGTAILDEFHASLHMSGTLEPLEEYRDSLGLSSATRLISYPSPFSSNNRRILFVRDVTTKYEELAKNKTMISTMWRYISDICNTFPHNTMVFFPSFNTLSLFRKNGQFDDIQRCLYVEEQAMSQSAIMDLVSDFKTCGTTDGEGATMFSVIGGRISEGMDFPAEQLEIAVIVGIPYPKPTARQRGLQRYYDLKFGKGWEYTVTAPTARKLLQSIGRLIRDEKDKGVAVILDKRAPRFKEYIRNMIESKDLLKDIHTFMKG